MNKQTELILAYAMTDPYYYKDWFEERLPSLFGKDSAERLQDLITTEIHNKNNSSLMIDLCDILLDDVDWDLIAEEIKNHRE